MATAKYSVCEIKIGDISYYIKTKNINKYQLHLYNSIVHKSNNVKNKHFTKIQNSCPTPQDFKEKLQINIVKSDLVKFKADLELLKLKHVKPNQSKMTRFTDYNFPDNNSMRSLYEIKFDDLSLFKLLKNKEDYKNYLSYRLYDRKNVKSKQLSAIKKICPTKAAFDNKFKIDIVKPNLTKEEAKSELLKLRQEKYSFCQCKIDDFSYFQDLRNKDKYKEYLCSRIYDKKDINLKSLRLLKFMPK